MTRCRATAKATGAQCRRAAIAGTSVCVVHGGRASQVRRAAARRVELAKLSADLPAFDPVDPSAALGEAVSLSKRLLDDLTVRVTSGTGTVTADDLDSLGAWVDRTARLAKLATDAGVAERRTRVAEAEVLLLAEAVRGIVRRLGHDPAAPAVVEIIQGELRALEGSS